MPWWPFANRAPTERTPDPVYAQLDALREMVRKLYDRVGELEGEEFKLSELRRQARNAVRSLERAAANAQDAPGRTNGRGALVQTPPPLIDPPGPRRNY